MVQATFRSGEIFALTLLIYFSLSQAINFIMKRLERRLSRGFIQGNL